MKQRRFLILVAVPAVFVVIGLGGTSGSSVAAVSYESDVSRPRTTDKENLARESVTAARSGQEMSGQATSSEAERRSESHPSGNYFQGEPSGRRNLDGVGLDNPHYVYGGYPSLLGDPSVQELRR